jgi:hypothetical protein
MGPSAILELLPAADALYYRLILVVVSPGGHGEIAALDAIRERTGAARINLSLELSRCLVPLADRQRRLQVSRTLRDIVSRAALAESAHGAERRDAPVLLHNIEILFEATLALDPLRLIKEISRHRTLVVVWPGDIIGGCLTYARPSHPEHRSYPVEDLILVGPSVITAPQP